MIAIDFRKVSLGCVLAGDDGGAIRLLMLFDGFLVAGTITLDKGGVVVMLLLDLFWAATSI